MRVAMFRAECPIAFNLFFRTHFLHQPMHANLGGVGGVESSYVTESPLFCFLASMAFVISIGEAAVEEVEEGFVRTTVVHLGKNFIDFRKEIARTYFVVFQAPIVAIN